MPGNSDGRIATLLCYPDLLGKLHLGVALILQHPAEKEVIKGEKIKEKSKAILKIAFNMLKKKR